MLHIQKGHEAVSKTFRLPVELVAHLEALAAQNRLSLNRLVIQCLEYAVEHIAPEDEEAEEEADPDT